MPSSRKPNPICTTCSLVLLGASPVAGGSALQDSVPTALASATSVANFTEEVEAGATAEGLEPVSTVEVLEERVAGLEERVARLEALIVELNDRIDELLASRSETASAAEEAPAPPPAPEPTPASSRAIDDPMASPATIIESMRRNFDSEMMTDPSFVLGLDSPDERARVEADRVLRSWVRRTEGRFRKRVTWPIELDEGVEQPNGERDYRVEVTGAMAGGPGMTFTQRVSERIAGRIPKWLIRPDLDRLLLKGMFEPKLVIVPRRQPANGFNTEIIIEEDHLMISEWVRLEFEVKLTTIIPVFIEQRRRESGDSIGAIDPPPPAAPSSE